MPEPQHRVLIAGAGIAGLEALIALHALAPDHVHTTLIAPDETFSVRALSVEDPFARPGARRYDVEAICAAHGATFRRDALAAVDPERRTVRTEAGDELPYDSLLLALGVRPQQVFPRAATFRGEQDAEAIHGVLQDVEGGWSRSVAFVVPPGVTWPLPLYELALMTAERASSLGLGVTLSIVTAEDAPLGVFGPGASAAVDTALHHAGIALFRCVTVTDVRGGDVFAGSERPVLRAQRVIALPTLAALALPGVPADADGFVPVDDVGRVPGAEGLFAAGDGTDGPIKQGGVAAQQADAAARAIAERAGARVVAQPLRPVLRAKLLTGTRSLHLRAAASGLAGDGGPAVSEHSLWWPPSKVAAPYLMPYLERVDHGDASVAPSAPGDTA